MNRLMTAMGLLIAFQLSAGPSVAQEWMIETVDSSVNVGYYTSIALDSQNLIHISYYDAYNDALEYARWTGSHWDIQTVDSDPPWGDVGRYTSIALDSSDYPHISYYKSSGGGVLKYACWDGTKWQTTEVETGFEKIYTSIAIDSSGAPHIAYCDEGPGDLKYARWDGFNWQITIVEDGFCSGYCTSIALDASDYPHISYIDGWDGDLRYARWDGSKWNITTVDAPGFYGFEGIMTSMALDASDLPHIAYTYWNTDDLRYAYYDGNNWQIETVDSQGITGKYPSIVLDSSDYPHISYAQVGSNFQLRYARWTGSDWQLAEVDSAGNSGFWSSIALDGLERPHVSYGTGGTSMLKHAWYYDPFIHVPDDFSTIQDAINAAMDGYTVIVEPGTYVENIDFLGKTIIVKSEQGACVTAIDGNQAGSVATFKSGEGTDTVLNGFTVKNGSGTSSGGGNTHGGGIYCYGNSSPAIMNNVITMNSADSGGGISCDSSSPTLMNNTITGNLASYDGGGIMAGFTSSPTVFNTIVWNNDSPTGYEIWINLNSTLFISYSDLDGGQASVHVEPDCTLDWGLGMIDADPYFADPVNNDFHLTWLSPCINMGTNDGAPLEDIDGESRPYMGTADIGVDEFTGTHPLEADVFILSEAAGGTVSFTLNGGAGNTNRDYLVLGSFTGTAPGTPLPGGMTTLPLNWDFFTNLVIAFANTPIFVDFLGTLGPAGSSSALFSTGPMPPGLAGSTFSFAHVLCGPYWDFASNPINVAIVP